MKTSIYVLWGLLVLTGALTCVADGREASENVTSRAAPAGSERPVPAWATMPEINTWRVFEENTSQSTIMEFVEQWEAHGFRFGCVTIDEGWTRPDAALGDWVPEPQRFANLRRLVDWLHVKGYRVRLWIAPMTVNEGTRAAKTLPRSYFLASSGGAQVRHPGRDALMLDPRVPAVRQHIAGIFERLTRDYDLDAYKVDFCFNTGENGQPSGYSNDTFSDEEHAKIQRYLFESVRKGCDAVKPGVRLEGCYPWAHCAALMDDVISGDLIGPGRSQASHEELDARLFGLAARHGWVVWPEMVWGLGSDTPVGNPQWERTYLEWLATDINYERKLELSFPPFEYANVKQIRTLTNLYASGGKMYKIIQAGKVEFDLEKLQKAGLKLTGANRFLAAPSEDTEIRFIVPPVCGLPSQWRAVNLLRPEQVTCIIRDENWEGGKRWHCVRFTARGGDVYEIRKSPELDAEQAASGTKSP